MIKFEMTRQEVARFIASCKETKEDPDCPYTKDQLTAVNDFIDYIVAELEDKELSYDTEKNYFIYTGPELPKIQVKRKN